GIQHRLIAWGPRGEIGVPSPVDLIVTHPGPAGEAVMVSAFVFASAQMGYPQNDQFGFATGQTPEWHHHRAVDQPRPEQPAGFSQRGEYRGRSGAGEFPGDVSECGGEKSNSAPAAGADSCVCHDDSICVSEAFVSIRCPAITAVRKR